MSREIQQFIPSNDNSSGIKAYCDGSSTGRSNKPWGWGFVMVKDENTVIGYGYGGGPHGTNNVGELYGAIGAMEFAYNSKIKDLVVVCDSMYVINMLNQESVPSKNKEIIEWMWYLQTLVKVKTEWVKGHSGNIYNEMADQLAKKGKKENTHENNVPQRQV